MSSLALERAVEARAVIRRAGWRWTLRQLFRKRTALIGGAVVLFLIVCALWAPDFVPYDPFKVNTLNRLKPPSAAHWLGTDELGRDLLSRVLIGARFFVLVCLISVSIAASVGVFLGLIAGSGPSWLDVAVMRVIDVMLAFPYILLTLAIIAILGPSLWMAMVSVGIAGIPGYARLVRGEVLAVKQEEYVEAMRALGAGPAAIMVRAILPNVASSIIIYMSFQMPLAVLAAAALSFLGLGAQPPLPEWGAMLVNARTFLRTAWWTSAAPGLAIFVSILALNLLGNALRDVLDPKSK